MTGRNRTFARIVTAFALVAIAVAAIAFFARGPIEREIFVRQAASTLGTRVDATSARYSGGAWVVDGLVVGDDLRARRAVVRGGSSPRVRLEGAAVTIPDPRASVDGLAGFERAFPHARVDVNDGRAAVGAIALEAIDGKLAFGGVTPVFDGTLALRDGATTYPIVARVATNGGASDQTVSAVALPAGAFAPFLEDSQTPRASGLLRDVDLTFARDLRGTLRLDDVAFELSSLHRLHGLHGNLIFGEGGIGSKKIAGSLDRVPFDAAGEVHDVAQPFGWLADGSRDLRAFEKLIREIADEPKLTSVHLDTTAPGIGFALYTMQTERGPLAVNVLAIDPSEPTLRFDTAIAEDHVVSNGERTSAMGTRTGAVAGVNGDYFDIGRTYQPQGMLERGGQIVRGPVERAALVIDKGNHVRFDLFRIVGSVRAGDRTYPVTQLNNWPAGAATVITTAFGKTLPAAAGVTFAALEPTGRANRYRVTRVTDASQPQPVTFGVAFGASTHAVVRPGETIDVTYRIDPRVDGAVAGIGGGPILVRDGAWYEDPNAPAPDERDYRWPVVALGRQADDHLLLVAVDGRHPERSIGMTRPEFADLLIRFGVTDAMALDSGGSVTMVSRAPGDAGVTVRNVPSDNSAERWVSDALFIYSTAAAPTLVAPAALATPIPEVRPTP